jgi:hypothetical protein
MLRQYARYLSRLLLGRVGMDIDHHDADTGQPPKRISGFALDQIVLVEKSDVRNRILDNGRCRNIAALFNSTLYPEAMNTPCSYE